MGFTYDQILHRTLLCERLDIDSLWLYDHLYGPGAAVSSSKEAWTLATALLSRTERVRIGHMVLCNQFRHPAVLAKMATTLDQISGGRLQLGIGSGSIEDEHILTGLDWGTFGERSERLGETLEILHQAFANEVIDFTGKHFTIHDMPIKPGPVQQPRPPIVVGGVGEKFTLPLVARYADVWNVPTYALGDLDHKVSVLRSICDEVGRDPSTIVLSVEAVTALAPDDAATGSAAARREAFRDTGLWPQGGRLGRHATGHRRSSPRAGRPRLRPDRVIHPRPRLGRNARPTGVGRDRTALGRSFGGRRVVRPPQPQRVLGDHVAEHLECSPVDTGGRRQPEDVLRSPVIGSAVGADRQARRRAEDVHQIRRDIPHGLGDRNAAEHLGCAHRGFHPRNAAPQPVLH